MRHVHVILTETEMTRESANTIYHWLSIKQWIITNREVIINPLLVINLKQTWVVLSWSSFSICFLQWVRWTERWHFALNLPGFEAFKREIIRVPEITQSLSLFMETALTMLKLSLWNFTGFVIESMNPNKLNVFWTQNGLFCSRQFHKSLTH